MNRNNGVRDGRTGDRVALRSVRTVAASLLSVWLTVLPEGNVTADEPAATDAPAPASSEAGKTEAGKEELSPEPADAITAIKGGDTAKPQGKPVEPVSAKIKKNAPPTAEETAAADQSSEEIQRRVEAVSKKMAEAKERLAGKQTDQTTQDLQKQILADLDELLKSSPSSSPPSSGGSGGGASSPRSSSQQNNSQNNAGKGSQQQQTAAGDEKGEQSTAQSGARNPDKEPVSESGTGGKEADEAEERSRAARQGKVVALPRRRLEVDVWGHLPEKVREKLLSAYSERMVPQYEDMVQQFYRSLADGAAPPASPP